MERDMGNDRAHRLAAEPVALPAGLRRLQAHVLEQFAQTAALRQVMGQREDGEATLGLLDAVLAARHRDCVVERVEGAADVILTYVQSPDRPFAQAHS